MNFVNSLFPTESKYLSSENQETALKSEETEAQLEQVGPSIVSPIVLLLNVLLLQEQDHVLIYATFDSLLNDFYFYA